MSENINSMSQPRRPAQSPFVLIIVWVLLMGTTLILAAQWFGLVQSTQSDLQAMVVEVQAALETDELLDNEAVIRLNDLNRIVAEITEIRNDVQQAEDRAFNLLGLFELVGLFVTISGVVIVAFGFVTVQRSEEARAEVEKLGEGLKIDYQEEVKKAGEEFEKLKQELLLNNESLQQYATNVQLAQSLARLAERQFRFKDLESARETYERALMLTPKDPALLYHLGYILTQESKLLQAKQLLTDANEIDPDLPQAQAALGFVYRRMGDHTKNQRQRDGYYRQSEKLLIRALGQYERLFDDDGESWWGVLGGLYKRRYQETSAEADWEKARFYYGEVVRVSPQSSYGYVNQVILQLLHTNNVPEKINQIERQEVIDLFQKVERIARFETLARVDNYWAYADLLHARLALGWYEAGQKYKGENEVDVTVTQTPLQLTQRFFEALPNKVKDATDRVISTIDLIQEAIILEGDRCPDETFKEVYAEFAKHAKADNLAPRVDNGSTNDDTDAQ